MKNLKIIIVAAMAFITLGLLNLYTCYAEESPCLGCHADFKKPAKSTHAALGMGCQSCHKAVEGKSHPDQKGSMVTNTEYARTLLRLS